VIGFKTIPDMTVRNDGDAMVAGDPHRKEGGMVEIPCENC